MNYFIKTHLIILYFKCPVYKLVAINTQLNDHSYLT